MFEWFPELLKAMNAALQEGAALSILLGLAVAIGGTQYVKRLDAFPSKAWPIRALALPLGLVTTYLTWPVHEMSALRFFIALATGLMSPLVYQAVTAALYWKWPNLEMHISAAPGNEP